MSKIKLPCEVVQDLLPSYIEELTSDVTSEAVRDHLNNCETCGGVYRRMIGDEEAELSWEDAAEIDFLKKNRKKTLGSVIGAIAATVILVMAGLGVRFFLVGTVYDAAMIDYSVSVSEREIGLYSEMLDYKYGISGLKFKEDGGTIEITARSVLASPIHGNTAYGSYTARSEFDTIKLNGMVIWKDGIQVSAEANRLVEKKNPYVGDVTADIAIANTIGIRSLFGEFTNELQTSEEPYRWTLISESEFDPETAEWMEQQLHGYGAMLIALIDNLGEVEFRYADVDGNWNSILITEAEADQLAGGSVKGMTNTSAAVQMLIEKLKVFNMMQGHVGQYVTDNIVLRVLNETDVKYYNIGFSLYINGDSTTSGGASNANGEGYAKGEIIDFEFTPEEYGLSLEESDQVVLAISLQEKDYEEITAFEVEIDPFDPQYYNGNAYERTIVMCGDEKSGLVINEGE